MPKENAIYSEPYRRLVAALPCARCKIEGYSQAAHPPPTGRGRKEDDRYTFPLCADRPMKPGCHPQFDQYKLMCSINAREQAKIWGEKTRNKLMADGVWPCDLPKLEALEQAVKPVFKPLEVFRALQNGGAKC